MNAIEQLKKEHRKVDTLFEKFESTKDLKKRHAIVQKIIHELREHAAIEEHVFYPKVEEQLGQKMVSEVAESVEEHLQVKRLLDDLDIMDPSHPQYVAKVHVLKETVQHHVKEEETAMFPEVKQALGAKALEQVGKSLDEDRATHEQQVHSAEARGKSQHLS